MGEVNEESLDRHFSSQLRMMGDVWSRNISNADYVVCQRWLQLFHGADRRDKYARNCLMLLMYGQLKEMGKLGKPFTELKNTHRQLDAVLTEYQGHVDNETPPLVLEEKANPVPAAADPGKQPVLPPLLNFVSKDKASSSSTTTSNNNSNNLYAACAPQLELIQSAEFVPNASFELLTQQNQALIKEINLMHSRTLENEQHYRQADSDWQQRIQQGQMQGDLPKLRVELLLPKVERCVAQSIRRLKDWTAASGSLNFLSTALREVLDDEPETRRQLQELDRKLEGVLEHLLEQAGERREKNVRMLYDQLFQQQQEALQTKRELLRHERHALAQAHQQLKGHVQELKQREQLFWKQQTDAVAQLYGNDPPQERPRSSSQQALQSIEDQRSVTTQTTAGTVSSYYNIGRGVGGGDSSSACGCPDCQANREQEQDAHWPSQTRESSSQLEQCQEQHTCQYCEL